MQQTVTIVCVDANYGDKNSTAPFTYTFPLTGNLKLANAFSPNGGGINDEWRIDQLRDYPNASLQLFDRYGQIIYTAKGNGITGWKGTAAGNKPVSVGAYYYILS